MIKIPVILSILFLVFACSVKNQNSNTNPGENKYARGFSISEENGVKKLTVFNPWEKAQNIAIDYYLLGKGKPIPPGFESKKIIRTPVERVICLSTTHIAFLDVLNETGKVVGVSGAQYVSNLSVLEGIGQGQIADVGYDQQLNYELILQQKPDVILSYGVGGEASVYSAKLEELGLAVVMNAEYLENSPLGKAEWIKFIACLFQKEKDAEGYFSKIEKEYLDLKEMVPAGYRKPKVMVGAPYQDSWWVPGGESFLARLIADAGGEYLGKQNHSHESFVISFENALTWAAKADVWINMGLLDSKAEIIDTDNRFASFPVLVKGKVFNNNARMSPNGGNDFWESGVTHPNLVLKDLIKVFYPELLQKENFTYYKEIH